jgi:hypothetical protein
MTMNFKKYRSNLAHQSLVAAVLMTGAVVAPTTVAQAGAVGGPVYQHDRVQAYSQVSYTIRCRGGEWTNLVVRGDGDTDLDLFVYDAAGNLVGSDTDLTDLCLVRWFSSTTQTYTVVVKNFGVVYNDFVIASD